MALFQIGLDRGDTEAFGRDLRVLDEALSAKELTMFLGRPKSSRSYIKELTYGLPVVVLEQSFAQQNLCSPSQV